MVRRPPRSNLPEPLLPYTALFRSRRHVDIVDVVQEVLGAHAVVQHQPVQGGAVFEEVTLLQYPRLFRHDAEDATDIRLDALVHLGEQVAMRRVEGVVEVEYPDLDIVQRSPPAGGRYRFRGRHAILPSTDHRARAMLGEDFHKHRSDEHTTAL